MKKFLFISYGFEVPDPAMISEWAEWFSLIESRIVGHGRLGDGQCFRKGSREPIHFSDKGGTGFMIFEAESLEEAEDLASRCPVIGHNMLQEIIPADVAC